MPTYAYACKQCGHRFDAVQSFADPALTVCPECGGPLRKEYGSIGVTFNGSGFYRTDSRAGAEKSSSGSSGASSSSGSSSSGDSGSGSSGSSASSKPEAKSSPASAGS
jgi:putative FmdB family regulatory protein